MDEQKQMVATLSMLKQLETPEGTEYLRSVMAEAGLPMPTREYLENLGPWQRASAGSGV